MLRYSPNYTIFCYRNDDIINTNDTLSVKYDLAGIKFKHSQMLTVSLEVQIKTICLKGFLCTFYVLLKKKNKFYSTF